MVGIMADAYNKLSEEEQERTFLLAVGKDEYSSVNSNFCKGFAMCADAPLNPWWSSYEANQRDVFFYIKTDPTDDSSWEYYCRYSMNTNYFEFEDTIKEMLQATSVAREEAGIEISDDALLDDINGTMGDNTTDFFSSMDPLTTAASTSTALGVSGSSAFGSRLSISLLLSAAVYVWSIL